MRPSIPVAAGALLCPGLFAAVQAIAMPRPADPPPAYTTVQPAAPRRLAAARLGRLPLAFEPNLGQSAPGVRYLSRNGSTTILLTDSGAVFRFQTRSRPSGCASCASRGAARRAADPTVSVVRVRLEGARPAPRIDATGAMPGVSNYVYGAAPFGSRNGREITGVPHFARVRYRGVYPGVDLVYYGRGGALEYDFRLAPGADPAKIRLHVDGARGIRVNGRGDLELSTAAGTMVQHAPVVYQEEGGARRRVAGAFARRGPDGVGFRLGRYDRAKPLVIDPVLSYGAVFGGTADDAGNAVAVDREGNILVTGRTASADFPTRNAVNDQFHGPTDAFVTKINAAGDAIVYSTYFSGARNVAGNAITVDKDGNAYVAGLYDKQHLLYGDIYTWDQDMLLFELSPTGQRLQGVFFGGTGDDVANGIALGPDGSIYVAGESDSWDYPDSAENEGMPVTPNAFQKERLGSKDAYVCRIDAQWSAFIYGTYLGGDGNLVLETAAAIAVDGKGDAFVTGSAGPGFWVTPGTAYQANYGGGFFDAYVTEFTPDGSGLVYSTLLGGEDLDQGTGIAVDAHGAAYITGVTYSLHLPVTLNAAEPEYHPGNCNPDVIPWYACSDSFVAKVDPTKSGAASLVYSTYLGGANEDDAAAIAVDSHGSAWVTGRLLDLTFPEVNPLPSRGTGWEGFVTQLSPDGAALLFSTYLGGGGTDWIHGIAVDPADNVYVTGETDSVPFPVTTAIQQSAMGGHNAFVVKIGTAAPVPGDVDGNGVADAMDVVRALRDAAGLEAPGAAEAGRADLAEPKGQVTLADAALLLRRLHGL